MEEQVKPLDNGVNLRFQRLLRIGNTWLEAGDNSLLLL